MATATVFEPTPSSSSADVSPPWPGPRPQAALQGPLHVPPPQQPGVLGEGDLDSSFGLPPEPAAWQQQQPPPAKAAGEHAAPHDHGPALWEEPQQGSSQQGLDWQQPMQGTHWQPQQAQQGMEWPEQLQQSSEWPQQSSSTWQQAGSERSEQPGEQQQQGAEWPGQSSIGTDWQHASWEQAVDSSVAFYGEQAPENPQQGWGQELAASFMPQPEPWQPLEQAQLPQAQGVAPWETGAAGQQGADASAVLAGEQHAWEEVPPLASNADAEPWEHQQQLLPGMLEPLEGGDLLGLAAEGPEQRSCAAEGAGVEPVGEQSAGEVAAEPTLWAAGMEAAGSSQAEQLLPQEAAAAAAGSLLGVHSHTFPAPAPEAQQGEPLAQEPFIGFPKAPLAMEAAAVAEPVPGASQVQAEVAAAPPATLPAASLGEDEVGQGQAPAPLPGRVDGYASPASAAAQQLQPPPLLGGQDLDVEPPGVRAPPCRSGHSRSILCYSQFSLCSSWLPCTRLRLRW
jgi:hypothetical protein